MNIEIIRSLEDAHKATGSAVVIDVFRAFTDGEPPKAPLMVFFVWVLF